MMTVYIGLGGNIGDTVALIESAVVLVCTHPRIDSVRCSLLYRSVAVSPEKQRDFVNGVCAFTSSLSPQDLLVFLQEIEIHLGKVPKPKEAPRPIDIDILLYGDHYVQESNLQIPHPYWSERLFVLLPMRELADAVWVPSESSIQRVELDILLVKCRNSMSKSAVRPLFSNEKILEGRRCKL